MPLQFILGAASRDHRAAVLAQIDQIKQADPQATVFYLVPNHLKFDAEVSLLQGLRAPGEAIVAQSAVQCFSFSRLAWYFLKDTPLYAQPRLDTAANAMLVARLLREHQDQLRLFKGLAHATGFVTKLAAQLAELLTGRIDAKTLAQAVAGLPGTDRHQAKLKDLVVMLDAYEQAVGPFATNQSLLAALSNTLTQADLTHTYFILNHFNDLAASELQLVSTMMQNAAAVTVCLTMPDLTVAGTGGPNLYLPATRLANRLLQAASRLHVPLVPPISAPKRALSDEMRAVERFFEVDTQMAAQPGEARPLPQLHLAQADSAYSELRHVAMAINAGVHAGGRYRDYLVIARHLDPYQDLITPVFAEYGIPVFTDLEHPMQQHPLVALLDSIFAIAKHNYQYPDVMRFLRTELVRPASLSPDAFTAAVDACDNHLLRTGINGSYWLRNQAWQYLRRRVDDEGIDADPEKTVQINQIRQFINATLPPLFADLQAAQDGAAAVRVLYQWLVAHGVLAALDARRQAAIASGDITQSHAGEQAWQTLIDLFDDYAALLGDAPFDQDQFVELLQAGFASATYTQIPSTLDQVVVSETALTRLPKFAHVFVIGATSLVMPDVPEDQGLLSAEDRELLQPYLPSDAWLTVSGPQSSLGDPFINYVAMLSANTSLTMSFPAFAEGELHPSPYFTRMQQALGLSVAVWGPVALTTPISALGASPRSLLSDLIAVMRLARDAKLPLSPAWRAVQAQLERSPLAGFSARLLASFDYDNDPGRLSPSLATALYGKHLNVSVSRLETYWRNPFEYFLKYGIHLSARPEFQLTPADTGSLYHATLDQVFTQLQAAGRQLADIEKAQLAPLVQEVLADLVAGPGFEILTTSQKMGYVKRRTQAMLTQVLAAIHDQQRRGQFRTRATELQFFGGNDAGLAPMVLRLPHQQSVTVRGKIDRLDTALVDGQEYFLIVDYKSSARQFKPIEAYAGTAMQMLTYIDATAHGLAKQGEQAAPAGALYMHLFTPAVAYAPQIDAEAAVFAEYKLNGLLVLPDDADAALTLATVFDETLDAGQTSAVVPIKLKNDGGFNRAGTRKVSPDELRLYLAHNRKNIELAATQILSGKIALAPIQYGKEATTITNSDFQPIMCFDPATGFDHYRHVGIATKDVLDKIREEQEDANLHPESD